MKRAQSERRGEWREFRRTAITQPEAGAMSHVTFKRITAEESRIYQDGDYVGDVYGHEDILNPGSRVFILHLDEDPRGPHRVHERRRIREVAQQLVDTHPFYG